MSKLNATFKTLPYFRPARGDLLTDAQVAEMIRLENWERSFAVGSMLAIDFADMDGLRADWLGVNGDYCRLLCVRTFANGKAFWLVVNTSY